MSCEFSILDNATDPLDIMNAVMVFDDPPPRDERWERRVAALCEALARRNAIVAKLPKCWRLDDDGKLIQDVSMVPNMAVWLVDCDPESGDLGKVFQTSVMHVDESHILDSIGLRRSTGICYTTEAAAEAAAAAAEALQ